MIRAFRNHTKSIFGGIILFILALVLKTIPMTAQNSLPPLIDREIFFGNPEIAGAQLSPNGQYMAFMKPLNDVRNIWVKKIDEPFENAIPVTASEKRPIPGFFWSRDSKYLLYIQDTGGDENFQIYALDPSEAQKDALPAVRNITNIDGVRVLIYSLPKSDPDVLYIGLNDRDKAWHDLYKLVISTGERTLIRENHDRVGQWVFDLQDQLRMAVRTTEDGGTELLNITDKGFEVCYACTLLETCYPVRFHKNGKEIYMVSNKGEADLTQLFLLNPANGETALVEIDPANEVDFGGAQFSDVTDEMILTSYVGDKTRLYFKDKAFEQDYEFLKEQFPGAEINMNSSTDDEQLFLINANSDTDPGATYLFNRKTRKIDFQYRPRPKLPVDDLASMTPIRYTSSDGMEIPAYLTVPKGIEAKGLPTIILPHGGPWARDYWGYDSYAQFLANRGYAVLQPNFRSSTGYGKTFLNAGNKEWGEKMQDDLTYGVKHLIDTGIADPKRIGIMGGSYGGYATLAGLTFTPDVYQAGVSIVGPSNLITLLESIPPYWEAGRKMFHERMGDPTTEAGKQQLMAQSPLFSAQKINRPLMVVQGANDPRVNKAESDQIVVAMRELSLPVEYIVAPDEGHGFERPVNNMAFLAAAEKFLAKHLGGRYQETMTEEVRKRLEEITVDIQSVTLPKALSEDALNAGLPTPVEELQPAKYSYKSVVAMGGQEIPLELTRTISEENGNWMIADVSNTMMGEATDKTILQKGSLLPISRQIAQGPVAIELQHDGNKITGKLSMNGNEQPIDATLEQPVFGDAGALHATVATLPLSVGYETIFRIFDLQSQKSRIFQLAVNAEEAIEVPAGKFQTFKVEITPQDGKPGNQTLWIATENKTVVKSKQVVPQMAGAVVTSSLSTVEK